MNLDFQWNYEQEPAVDDDKKFPILSVEEIQSIYSHQQALKSQKKISSVNKSGDLIIGTEYARSTGMKGSGTGDGGEIIHVQGGGRIIRATGRKDRHSKVYTSKGPRDRRVRLSAHTAIQFYDVQDRLGYDRPSKAVDWLINKAKDAIDNLSQPQPPPPPPQEEDEVVTLMDPAAGSASHQGQERQSDLSSSKYALQLQRHLDGGDLSGNSSCSSLMPPPRSPAEVPDSMMKSFFPMTSGNSSLLNNLSRTGRIQTGGDLGLSLQTLQDHQNHRSSSYADHELLLSAGGTNPVPFHETNYPKPHESWNGAGDDETTRHVGFIFNSHSVMPQQLFYSPINSAIFSQRESNYPHITHSSSWNDRQFPSSNNEDHQTDQSSSFSVHFGSNFQVPARIHGEDEPSCSRIHSTIQQPSSIIPGSQQL